MTPQEILDRIPQLRALVVGDICLDRWCTYDPALSEPSRETGLPRTAVIATATTPGAGGTVANNLAALGAARVAVLGVVGDDGFGYELRQALATRGIDAGLLVAAPVPTFTYTKLLNRHSGAEDLGRVDFVLDRDMPASAEQAVITQLRAAAPEFDAILISDQAETERGGVVTPAVRDALAALAAAHPEKIFFVDSRLRPEHFRGVTVKPNEREAREACDRLFGRTDYAALRAHIGCRLLLVTHGGEGVLILDDAGEQWVKTVPVASPVDICGAGDSFSAGAALALAAGAPPCDAARFGNLVASVTIMKSGTGTASPAEVLAAAARANL
jgi:rfaE bifunctional protein kinase chain/domain